MVARMSVVGALFVLAGLCEIGGMVTRRKSRGKEYKLWWTVKTTTRR